MNERFRKSMLRLRPHGRARYAQGCRCFQCRLACAKHTADRRTRRLAGELPNGLVPSDKAIAHLRLLREAGVGLGTIAEITGIAKSILSPIRLGKVGHIRAKKERLILNVTTEARIAGSRVSSKKLRRMVKQLQFEGFTHDQIAERSGVSRGSTFTKRKKMVFARTEMRVEKFFNQIMAGGEKAA